MKFTSSPRLEGMPVFEKECLQKIEAYLLTNLSDPNLKVSDLAMEMGMSERQIYRKVKDLLGLTPNAMLTQMRLQQAKAMLEKGQYATVSEVAFAVGYKSPDYFSSVFESTFGHRPISYYRKQHSRN